MEACPLTIVLLLNKLLYGSKRILGNDGGMGVHNIVWSLWLKYCGITLGTDKLAAALAGYNVIS